MYWIIFLTVTIIFWGSYNLFYKAISSTNMDIYLSLLITGLVSALVAIPFLFNYINEGIDFNSKGLIFSVIMGLCMGIGTIFFFYTFKYGASASTAIPIFGIGALLIGAVGGILFFSESINLRMISGFVLGVMSIILLAIK